MRLWQLGSMELGRYSRNKRLGRKPGERGYVDGLVLIISMYSLAQYNSVYGSNLILGSCR